MEGKKSATGETGSVKGNLLAHDHSAPETHAVSCIRPSWSCVHNPETQIPMSASGHTIMSRPDNYLAHHTIGYPPGYNRLQVLIKRNGYNTANHHPGTITRGIIRSNKHRRMLIKSNRRRMATRVCAYHCVREQPK